MPTLPATGSPCPSVPLPCETPRCASLYSTTAFPLLRPATRYLERLSVPIARRRSFVVFARHRKDRQSITAIPVRPRCFALSSPAVLYPTAPPIHSLPCLSVPTWHRRFCPTRPTPRLCPAVLSRTAFPVSSGALRFPEQHRYPVQHRHSGPIPPNGSFPLQSCTAHPTSSFAIQCRDADPLPPPQSRPLPAKVAH